MPGDGENKVGFFQDLNWRLEAVAFKALFAFLRALGVERASGFGGKLLRTLGPLTGTHKTVTRNLRIAFPDMDAGERDRLAVDQWEQTGRTFAELAVMDRLTPESGRIDMETSEQGKERRAARYQRRARSMAWTG